MVRRFGYARLLLMSLLVCGLVQLSYAGKTRLDVKFFKLNKKGQLVRYHLLMNTDEPGCHNLSRKHKVHRFGQIGYLDCQLFSERNCTASSQLKATWSGDEYRNGNFDISQPQLDLIPGTMWLLAADKNEIVRSWSCRI